MIGTIIGMVALLASSWTIFAITRIFLRFERVDEHLTTLHRRVDCLWSTRDEICDTIACRLNRLETKLDSEVVRLDKQLQKLATDSEAHEANIEILRIRTNWNGNPMKWQAETDGPDLPTGLDKARAERALQLDQERCSMNTGSGVPIPSDIFTPITDHRTDELSQERDEAQDTASSLYVTPPGFEPVSSTEETARQKSENNYLAYCQILRKLDAMFAAGADEASQEYQSLLDESDKYWFKLTPSEKHDARLFSESLCITPCQPTTATSESSQRYRAAMAKIRELVYAGKSGSPEEREATELISREWSQMSESEKENERNYSISLYVERARKRCAKHPKYPPANIEETAQ